jgi:hypothetical protein
MAAVEYFNFGRFSRINNRFIKTKLKSPGHFCGLADLFSRQYPHGVFLVGQTQQPHAEQ